MQRKQVKYIKMNISYHRDFFPNVKYYPAKEEDLDSLSLRTEDGLWFGLDLTQQISINVHLFFFERRWNTNCEYCERDIDGEWNHYFDSNIIGDKIKIKYV